ncbi:acetate/propionate family kinase [Angustibacter sp. Root456]|uniref:acetate/propionate family kinase n=1 Tax=Angustibacter sp. Root456 TaxID=1736539 RepID=UPI0006FA244A|nr:acetate/propionate family kinase [Angustibacter sp. Root456]KQX62765.1 acetate kinase [Angustibacter sp. Root456]
MSGAGDGLSVLVVNAGSSSIKLRLLGPDDEVLATTDLHADRHGFDEDELRVFLHGDRPDVVGHRVVHGGTQFTDPTLIDDEVVAELGRLVELAPLHQPAALKGIEAVHDVLPDVASVACFDTSFHTTLPPAAFTYALPREWLRRWPIRRYGFHGLSHAYASRHVAELARADGLDVDPAALRTVVCHLGAGASLCAVKGGRSVDTTMGFTPLEGLVMATRSGSVDPGLVLWLLRDDRLSLDDLEEGLEHESGLLGLGGSKDLRDLVDGDGPDPQAAALALDVYVHRLVTSVAAMTASLGGLDLLGFTGGVGEHDAVVRSRVAQRLAYLGVALDAHRNDSADGDTDVTAPGAAVRTYVVAAREDLQIAQEARRVVAG